MGYERNDRRPGGYSGERGGFGGRDADRGRDDHRGGGTSYGNYGGAGPRDYRGDRFNDDGGRDYGRDPRGYDYDRGFFERAGDEVRSWFGDDDADRRRREDERRDQSDNRSGERSWNDREDRGATGADRGSYGSRGTSAQDYGAQGSASRGYGGQGYEDRSSGGRDQGAHHDPSYRSWRDRQMQSFDRDYDDYRRENQSRFDQEFHSWRQGRQGQRDLLAKVKEHAEVVGSDGQHIGSVDHVRGDQLKLTKSDEAAGGHHHLIPSSWIQSVDDKVTLNKTADQAKQQWRDADRESGGGLFGRNDDREAQSSGTRPFDRAFGGHTDR